MHHCSDEDLILHHYGEHAERARIVEHLRACAACREVFGHLQKILGAIDVETLPVPERSESYGREVWQRVNPRLHQDRYGWIRPVLPLGYGMPQWAIAGGFAVLLVAAFIAGRYSPRDRAVPVAPPSGTAVASNAAEPVRERVLLIAVGDHLDRSQMVLAELVNAVPHSDGHAAVALGPVDISDEQQWAQDLVASNRLYRQTAEQTGQTTVESVLDELEPILLEIAHSPASISADQLAELKQRIEEQGLLFKIRIVESNVRERQRKTAASMAGPVS